MRLKERHIKPEGFFYKGGLKRFQSGDYIGAIDQFEIHLEALPYYPNTYYYLGMSYKFLGNKNISKIYLNKAAALGSEKARMELGVSAN